MAEAGLSDTEMRAWQALLHAYQQVVRTLDRELRDEHGLPLASYDVLLRLARAPDRTMSMTELAARVVLSPSGVTRAVDRLVAGGLVERRRDLVDGRLALACLTTDGLNQLKQASKTHLRGVREHFTGQLSESQLRAVAGALERITGPHTPH